MSLYRRIRLLRFVRSGGLMSWLLLLMGAEDHHRVTMMIAVEVEGVVGEKRLLLGHRLRDHHQTTIVITVVGVEGTAEEDRQVLT
jgi:hypothetical protein